MALGHRDLSTLVTLAGWDAGQLNNFRLQDGISYTEVVANVAAALNALNAEIVNSPWVASLVSFTDQPETEYRQGQSNGFETHTEWARPDAKRAETVGHMLPLRKWDRFLGWTWDYLREARLTQIAADVADSISDARSLMRQRILARMLKRGDDSGAANGLGASGLSAGFATAAASTGVDFIPPQYAGVAFDSNHEHYVSIAGGAFTAAVFTDAKDELREHGHEPPYEFSIGPVDEATVRGLTGFVPAPAVGVIYGNAQNLAAVAPEADSVGSYLIGVLNDFRVRVISGIPQYYGFGYKSYGPRSQRNPLKVRVPKGNSLPAFVAMTDPRAGSGAFPLQNLMLFSEFGVGVGDRTAATPRYVNNATWADGVAG